MHVIICIAAFIVLVVALTAILIKEAAIESRKYDRRNGLQFKERKWKGR